MPLPKDVLDRVADDIQKANSSLTELKDVVGDMRLSGLDTEKYDADVKDLTDKIRSMEVFYERQKAKSQASTGSKK